MKVGDLVKWRGPGPKIVGIITNTLIGKRGWFRVNWITRGTVEFTREPAMHLEVISEK